ncbi:MULTISPECIES: HNH endonuclease signature motif containing protein [Microbacterium]|uniref:HNH endonuclease signature motif containing protein n=1 Tax=Microbacterium TaxID=33882 RepID=UPI000D64CF0A|nr:MULTISPECIES: HNH endonuclease signature motif containing protein [Microbacterium]
MSEPTTPTMEEPARADDFDEESFPPVPDAVDLVVETAAMMSVFAAERLMRIDLMRREALRETIGRADATRDIVERSIRLELAAAMRITEYSAGRLIVQAEALVRHYPSALAALSAGRITEKHAEVLVDLLDEAPQELRDGLLPRAVTLAESEPVGTFRRALRGLIETVQALTLEERHTRAVAQRRVVVEAGQDGMAALWLFGPAVEIHAIHGRLTRMAKTMARAEGGTRTLDQLRMDAAADLLIDGATDHLPAEASGIRAQVVVTVPALSLLDGEFTAAGDPPVVEGVGPIPLSKARALCGGDARWMRVLTHPETGMVLSVGRDSYRPPAALQRLVRWRADRCMGPGCSMPASRCEIDHQVRWADDGDTCLDNTLPFCKGHHLVKDNTDWRVRQIEGSGGAVVWTSPTGRTYVVRPERKVPTFTSRPSASGDAGGLSAAPPF